MSSIYVEITVYHEKEAIYKRTIQLNQSRKIISIIQPIARKKKEIALFYHL